MLEKVLIVILVLLAGALLSHILWRKRQERGNIRLKEAAVKDLMTAMQNNIKFGRIQEVAGKVSHILKEYLGCDRILFIKYYRGFLEVNYYHGLQNPDRERLRIRLTPELQSKFKSFQTASRLEALTAAISKEYIDRLRNLGLSYFFPVYLRDNLYGVYFIKTDLTPETSSLNFLSAALAYSLSTAYHIGVQEQQIKKFEGKIQQLSSAKPKIPSSGLQQSGEYARFLKIKNSKQLIPELLTALRKECDFSKMAFYLESENSGDALIAINWNLEPEVDKILRENYSGLAEKMEVDRIIGIDDLARDGIAPGSNTRVLKDREVRYFTSIPWAGDRKAILAWNGKSDNAEIAKKLKRFQAEAMPLVDNAAQFEKIEEMCYTDGLTGIHNFRFFRKRLNEEFMRAKRYNRNLALLIFDIDALKAINDKYGHLAGDDLLRSFGKTLSDSVRLVDVVSRYGGDEFCLIMPEADREKAQLFMERFREKIAIGQAFLGASPGDQKYSVSIGGAVFPIDAGTVDDLIKAADMALLKAKSEGRNRSMLYSEESVDKV